MNILTLDVAKRIAADHQHLIETGWGNLIIKHIFPIPFDPTTITFFENSLPDCDDREKLISSIAEDMERYCVYAFAEDDSIGTAFFDLTEYLIEIKQFDTDKYGVKVY